MAIGGSVLLILAGVLIASGPGARPGLLDVRYTGMALSVVGILVLAAAIGAWYRQIWARERRREGYARTRSALRRATVPAAPAAAAPAGAPRTATVPAGGAPDARRTAPWYARGPASGFRRRPLRPYTRRGVAEPEPVQPLSALGSDSLVDQTQVPGQHGKLPPSPLGRLRYPC